METTTSTFRMIAGHLVFEAQTDYMIDQLATAFHATTSRKEKSTIREQYLALVKTENEKRGFKCFNTII